MAASLNSPGTPAAQPSHQIGVRPAQISEATAIGTLHRNHLEAVLRENAGGELAEEAANALANTDFISGWESAISAPPSAAHHVLVAHTDAHIDGFLALAPAVAPEGYAEIIALVAQTGDEYDRLINAAADLARATHALGLTAWAIADDAQLVHALSSAGFAPSGNRRQYQLGDKHVQEHHWLAAFVEALSENGDTGE